VPVKGVGLRDERLMNSALKVINLFCVIVWFVLEKVYVDSQPGASNTRPTRHYKSNIFNLRNNTVIFLNYDSHLLNPDIKSLKAKALTKHGIYSASYAQSHVPNEKLMTPTVHLYPAVNSDCVYSVPQNPVP